MTMKQSFQGTALAETVRSEADRAETASANTVNTMHTMCCCPFYIAGKESL